MRSWAVMLLTRQSVSKSRVSREMGLRAVVRAQDEEFQVWTVMSVQPNTNPPGRWIAPRNRGMHPKAWSRETYSFNGSPNSCVKDVKEKMQDWTGQACLLSTGSHWCDWNIGAPPAQNSLVLTAPLQLRKGQAFIWGWQRGKAKTCKIFRVPSSKPLVGVHLQWTL